MQLIGQKNSLNNQYLNLTNLVLPIINDIVYPNPTVIATSGVTLDSTAYGKVILFTGDNSTRFDITLPPIYPGDEGKKISFIGGLSQICGRIIAYSGQFIQYDSPYVEIGASYSITFTAVEENFSSNNYWVIESFQTPPIFWRVTQGSQTISSGGSPTQLTLGTSVYNPYGAWSVGSGQSNWQYDPGYIQATCQVTIAAAAASSDVELYAYIGSSQSGDPVKATVGIGKSETLTLVWSGYNDGVSSDQLSFRIKQTTSGALNQSVTSAYVTANYIAIGP